MDSNGFGQCISPLYTIVLHQAYQSIQRHTHIIYIYVWYIYRYNCVCVNIHNTFIYMHCRGMHLSLRTRALTCQAANFTSVTASSAQAANPTERPATESWLQDWKTTEDFSNCGTNCGTMEDFSANWEWGPSITGRLKMISVGDFSNFWWS
jgi:hypothetical protein